MNTRVSLSASSNFAQLLPKEMNNSFNNLVTIDCDAEKKLVEELNDKLKLLNEEVKKLSNNIKSLLQGGGAGDKLDVMLITAGFTRKGLEKLFKKNGFDSKKIEDLLNLYTEFHSKNIEINDTISQLWNADRALEKCLSTPKEEQPVTVLLPEKVTQKKYSAVRDKYDGRCMNGTSPRFKLECKVADNPNLIGNEIFGAVSAMAGIPILASEAVGAGITALVVKTLVPVAAGVVIAANPSDANAKTLPETKKTNSPEVYPLIDRRKEMTLVMGKPGDTPGPLDEHLRIRHKKLYDFICKSPQNLKLVQEKIAGNTVLETYFNSDDFEAFAVLLEKLLNIKP
ncbi:MAG: hypothetical protein V4691_08150 [Pseudomonadota bacterium]